MPCPDGLRVHAYFDGEVDAIAAADVERHIASCGECTALLQDLEQSRTLFRALQRERTPPTVLNQITAALDRESAAAAELQRGAPPATSNLDHPIDAAFGRANETATSTEREDPVLPDRHRTVTAPRSTKRTPVAGCLSGFWTAALSGILSAACAATIAVVMLAPSANDPLLDELVTAHVRSLMPAHLIDVESTDKHTVKPWFSGHADVSPVVADFASQGFRLVGGRADYFDHQRAAVLVYQYGAHVINVFSFAHAAHKRSVSTTAVRDGYHLSCWQADDLDYCAISDAGWPELERLKRLLSDLSAGDTPVSQ